MSGIKNLVQSLFGEKISIGGKSFSIELVDIPAGKFLMGSPEKEEGRLNDETLHEVTLTHGFRMGKYPVTQAQWEAIMGENHSFFSDSDPRLPMDSVSWEDCHHFLHKLSKLTSKKWRLPTEAEWEYACRAGTQTALNSGKDLVSDFECPHMEEVGWYGRNSHKTLHPVGEKKPNAWGLYDMHGSIYEWCSDGYEPYPAGPLTDPQGKPNENGTIVLRGGCWLVSARSCRSANRGYGHPEDRHEMYGFRVVCDLG